MEDITNDEITEEQLLQLDKLIKELNGNSKGHTRIDFVGDDDLMTKAVTNAANYVNGKERCINN